MTKAQWITIKQSKSFYVRNYRNLISLMIFSSALSLVFCILIYFVYMSRPEHVFYSTNGVTAPIKLTVMSEPNYSDVALLPPDPIDNAIPKLIPE